MDIASVASQLSYIETKNAVDTKVLDMSLENFESTGAQIVDMIKMCDVMPHIGSNIDITV
jgi:hypothetical protein